MCSISVQFKMVPMRSEKPICVSPGPSLRSFPNVAFETVPMFSQRLSLSGNRWCDVLGFVPAGSASSFSTLQIFREASRLWGLLSPPVYMLGHLPNSLRRVLGSTPTGVLEGGCWPLTHSSLTFPFRVSLFVASSLNCCWHRLGFNVPSWYGAAASECNIHMGRPLVVFLLELFFLCVSDCQSVPYGGDVH